MDGRRTGRVDSHLLAMCTAERLCPRELSRISLHLEVLVAGTVSYILLSILFLEGAYHFDLQNLKALASLRTKVIPFDG